MSINYDYSLKESSRKRNTWRDLEEDDLIDRIPKKACLAIKNSGPKEMIEVGRLGWLYCLGLYVALMYEKRLGS